MDKRSILLEQIEREKWRAYRRNPLFWLEDRFGEDPKGFKWSMWGDEYDTHDWDGDVNPISEAWLSVARGDWTGIHSATSTGKTYTLARIVLWYLDVYEDSLVVTSAPKESQLKLHLWAEISKIFGKFKKIRPYSELYALRLVVDSREFDKNADEESLAKSWQAVGFVAGAGADETSATKAQGFHRKDMLIITEETPGMGNAVMVAFENTSTADNNIILAVGNPDAETDTLGVFCSGANVKSFRASALDFPNVVLNKTVIDGAVTQKSIDRRALKYGIESPLYISRVHGLFPAQSSDSLIKLEWIKQCLHSDVKQDYTYNTLGVDVANSVNGDKAALAWGEGNILLKLEEFQCPNATHLAYNVMYDSFELADNGYTDYHTAKLIDFNIDNECIGIDAVGVGVATVNAFTDRNYDVYPLQGGQLKEAIPTDEEGKQMYNFDSLRAQMYWEAREDLRQGLISISLEDKDMERRLIRELVIPKWETSKRSIIVESKQTIKKRMGGKSPNLADVFVYWNWTRKGHHVTGGDMPMLGGS